VPAGDRRGCPACDLGGVGRRSGGEERTAESAGNGGALERVVECVVRLPEVLHGVRGARQRFREPELEQHPRSPLRRGRLLERSSEIGHRAIGRPPLSRPSRCFAQRVDDPALATAGGQEHLCGHLLAGRTGVAEDARRPAVLQLALAWGQVVVDGVPNERVNKPERRVRPQDVRPDQPVGRLPNLALVQTAERRDGRYLGVLAQHGDGTPNVNRLASEPSEPRQHGARDGARAEVADDVDVIGVRPDTVERQRRQQLVE
jgi:hypothetical protein